MFSNREIHNHGLQRPKQNDGMCTLSLSGQVPRLSSIGRVEEDQWQALSARAYIQDKRQFA